MLSPNRILRWTGGEYGVDGGWEKDERSAEKDNWGCISAKPLREPEPVAPIITPAAAAAAAPAPPTIPAAPPPPAAPPDPVPLCPSSNPPADVLNPAGLDPNRAALVAAGAAAAAAAGDAPGALAP